MFALPAVGAGLAGASLIGSFLNKPNYNTPDISGELARIQSLFENMRTAATNNINTQAAQGRTAAASNLAARGIYRAPVSENTFNQLEKNRVNAIATSDAQIGGQEAGATSDLLRSLLGLNYNNNVLRNQANAQNWGQLGNLGFSLLLPSLLRGNGGTGGGGGAGTAAFGAPPANNYVMRPEDRISALLNYLGVPNA